MKLKTEIPVDKLLEHTSSAKSERGELNKFRNQGALTVIAKIKRGETQNLRTLLARMVPPHTDVESNGVISFAELTTIHFARFVVVDKSLGEDGTLRLVEPFLVLSTNYDDPLDKHLEQLVDVAGDGLDKIYSHCEGYPDLNGRTRQSRLAYLWNHMRGYGAFHNGTVGLSVERIRAEAKLRDEIENFIDRQKMDRDWSIQSPLRIREDIVRHIGQSEFSWALQLSDNPPLSYYLFRRSGWRTLLTLFTSLPLFIVFFPFWAIILRYKENTDKIFPHTRYDERAKELAAREDKVVQNQMTALNDMKPGLFRLLTLKFIFVVIEFGARYIFTKGNLGGIPTIHFARWVFVDNNRALLFFSNYGGSWESYLGDFVDKASNGLTGIWSNTVLHPRARWLILDGATDEERFKVTARAGQMITDVWYTAYKTLTVKNIINNKEIRKGLSGDLTDEQAREWLRRL